MGWLSNKVLGWATRSQRAELAEFISRLHAMDGSEIGLIVACATNHRHVLATHNGWDLLNPATLEIADPMIALKLGDIVRSLQGKGRPELAAGTMVWLHTVRAASNLDLRQSGREMWRELSRGFDHAEEAAVDFATLTGHVFDTHGYDTFPAGLTPERL